MKRVMQSSALAMVLAAGLLGCRPEPSVELDFSHREPPPPRTGGNPNTLRVAVGAMVSPETTFDSYEGLVRLIAESVGRRPEFVQRRTYEEINRMLLNGEIDIAFLCTGAYVSIRDRVRFLAAPVMNGSPTYRSYIVVRAGGPTTLDGIRGERFAFTDPLSNTGRLYPIYLLRTRFGEGPRQFFGTTVYTGGHDESLRALLAGTIDAAAIDGSVFDAHGRADPHEIEGLTIVHRSPPFGSPPFVARADLDPAVADTVRTTLLRAHLEPASRALLDGIGIERFATDADYSFAARVAEVALGETPMGDAPP